MITNPQAIQLQLFENLIKVQEALVSLGFDSLLPEIKQAKQLLLNKKYKVAVVGEFKKGKSSLINALLGTEILPADSTPTTAIVSRIVYADQPKVEIKYKDGESKTIGIKELSEFVTKEATGSEKIDEAIIQYPSLFSQSGIELIDTPGLNDEELMTKRTLDCLESVDAIIFATHARIPFSETETKSVVELIKNPRINNLIFVITYIDQIDKEDYDKLITFLKKRITETVIAEIEKESNEKLLAKAHRLLNDINFYEISSSFALKANLINNLDLLKNSKLPEFKEGLLINLSADQLNSITDKTIKSIEKIIEQFPTQQNKTILKLKMQIEGNEDIGINIEKYNQKIAPYVGQIFEDAEDRITKIINSLNVLKNLLATRISNAMRNESADIDSIVANIKIEAIKCKDTVSKKYRPAIINSLKEVFSPLLASIRDFRKNNFIDALSNAADHSSNTNQLNLSISLVSKTFSFIEFEWSDDFTLSTNADETDDSILNVIDDSVTKYINTYQAVVLVMRKHIIKKMHEEVASLKQTSLQQLDKKQIETQVELQHANYASYQPRTKAILDQVKKLQSDLESN